MSIKYKLVEKANPQNRSEKKWYATTVTQGTAGQREIAQNIAEKSSLTTGDIANTIENLLQEVPKILAQGKTVKLGDFGSFRISIGSEGSDTEKAFNATMINKTKIIFTPGKLVKKALSDLHFEKE